MKKLTNYQRATQYLNKIFKLINAEYFSNELEMPTITIQSTTGAYGHVSVNKVWHAEEATHELNLSADYMNRPIENVVATLIHEGCHLYAMQQGIKDTSNRGVYHNSRFKTLAEARGLSISKHEKYGWTITEPTEESLWQQLTKTGTNSRSFSRMKGSTKFLGILTFLSASMQML